MGRPQRAILVQSATSLRRFRGNSPLPPSRASALRGAAAVLLLAAAVALPCAVLYRAAVDTTAPVYIPRARRPLLQWDPQPLPPAEVTEEEGEFDTFPTGDLVGFASSLLAQSIFLSMFHGILFTPSLSLVLSMFSGILHVRYFGSEMRFRHS